MREFELRPALRVRRVPDVDVPILRPELEVSIIHQGRMQPKRCLGSLELSFMFSIIQHIDILHFGSRTCRLGNLEICPSILIGWTKMMIGQIEEKERTNAPVANRTSSSQQMHLQAALPARLQRSTSEGSVLGMYQSSVFRFAKERKRNQASASN